MATAISNYSDSTHTEIQDNYKIQTDSEMPNDPQKLSYELDLLNDLQEAQIKTEEETDKKETKQLENQEDLHKLPDETYIQNENTVETNEDELTCDNEIFGDILKKMKALRDESKEKNFEKNILIDECQIFNDFFNLIEKNEKKFTDEDLLVIKRGLELLINATCDIDSSDALITDLDYAKDIFYMYFNLINLPVIQNYFKNGEMSDDLKMLYRICISEILLIMFKSSVYTNLDLNDLQRPNNCIELLSLMVNYVKKDLKSLDSTLQLSYINTSMTRRLILGVIQNYADKTIMVPDVIKAGCLEIAIDGLIMICK
jgi:hypothetical protein